MRVSSNSLLGALVICALPTLAASATMDEEIDALLDAVISSECVFVRNGKAYDVDDAVSHLQLKRKNGGRYFKTAEQFIKRIASKSSFSGKPYEIHCDEVPPQSAFDWFSDRLQEIRTSEQNDLQEPATPARPQIG
jgi:hypothetical protein